MAINIQEEGNASLTFPSSNLTFHPISPPQVVSKLLSQPSNDDEYFKSDRKSPFSAMTFSSYFPAATSGVFSLRRKAVRERKNFFFVDLRPTSNNNLFCFSHTVSGKRREEGGGQKSRFVRGQGRRSLFSPGTLNNGASPPLSSCFPMRGRREEL